MREIYPLLALFLGHLLGDFTPLLTSKMIEAKEKGKPLLPILIHASVHAAFVFFFLMIFKVAFFTAISCAVFEMFAHFAIDTMKGKAAVKYPCTKNPKKQMFWTILGVDQFLHIVCKTVIYFWAFS